jgi:uncharacterized protein YkwD
MRRASLAFLAIMAMTACDAGATSSSSTSAPRPSEGSARHIQEIQAVAHASGTPAHSYGIDRPHTASEVEQAILARVDDAYRGDLTHDPALSAMVRDLAVTSPSRFDMPPTLLDALLAWHGIPDPEPVVVVVELEGSEHGCDRAPKPDCQDALDALVEEVLATLDTVSGKPRWRYGVGVTAVEDGARTRMMVALVERAIELEPIPVALPAKGELELKGKLLGKRHEPRIERVDPDGQWTRLPAVVGNDGSVRADIRCDAGNGAYQVEVLADGKLGPEVVANFKVFCGVDRPSEIRFGYERLGPKVTTADVVRGNFDLLNAEREGRGLSILAWDDRAATVAKAHSEDMLANDFVGHVSQRTGDAGARFERAGITGIVVRENVARGYGPKGIHESLMNSPGHRANLLAADVTHVGIGVVFGEPESTAANAPRPVFLTQNFYSKPGADVPAKPSSALRDRVDEQRVAAGLGRLKWNQVMNQIAQRRADGAAGLGPDMSDEDLREQLAGLGLASLEQHQVAAGSFEALVALDVWAGLPNEAKVGVGVAAAGDDIVMVILVGR